MRCSGWCRRQCASERARQKLHRSRGERKAALASCGTDARRGCPVGREHVVCGSTVHEVSRRIAGPIEHAVVYIAARRRVRDSSHLPQVSNQFWDDQIDIIIHLGNILCLEKGSGGCSILKPAKCRVQWRPYPPGNAGLKNHQIARAHCLSVQTCRSVCICWPINHKARHDLAGNALRRAKPRVAHGTTARMVRHCRDEADSCERWLCGATLCIS